MVASRHVSTLFSDGKPKFLTCPAASRGTQFLVREIRDAVSVFYVYQKRAEEKMHAEEI